MITCDWCGRSVERETAAEEGWKVIGVTRVTRSPRYASPIHTLEVCSGTCARSTIAKYVEAAS